MSITKLIVPGIGNSGPDHWQSLWEMSGKDFIRIEQRSWDYPTCQEWVENLELAARQKGPALVVIAHSLGCLAVAHWAANGHSPIKAALLVAAPDPAGPDFPKEAIGFAPLPHRPFSFSSIVVASDDDPYGSLAHAEKCASAWGSRLVRVGAKGHINAQSGLGIWPEGKDLLQQLCS